MPAVQRLDAVCDISMGQAPSGEAYNNEGDGWPLIAGAGDFGEIYPAAKKHTTEASRLSKVGDIVLGVRATIGEKVISDGEYCLGRGVAGLRVRKDLDSRYLWHWLTHIKPLLAAKSKGATFKQVNKEDIGELGISLPSLPEQRRIAAILDQADALRAKRREALAQLDSLTQSIFIEMFGDPVTNPKNCASGKLGEAISEMQYGPRFYNEAYSSEGIRIVRITDLDVSGILDFDSMPRMEVDEDANSQFILRSGDIVFARTGATVGKSALISQSNPPCIAGAYFIRLRFKDSVLPEYAHSVLRTTSVQTLIEIQSRQAAQQNFSGPGLRRLPMPIPSLPLQQMFKDRLTAIQRATTAHKQSLAQLSALFAALQNHAFRGEL